jgi:hypothetical protein
MPPVGLSTKSVEAGVVIVVTFSVSMIVATVPLSEIIESASTPRADHFVSLPVVLCQ